MADTILTKKQVEHVLMCPQGKIKCKDCSNYDRMENSCAASPRALGETAKHYMELYERNGKT